MFAHGLRYVSENRLHNGYFYSTSNTVGDKTYLYCKEKQLKSCPATAKIVGEQFVLHKEHNHPIDDRLITVHAFNESLFEAVTSSLRSPRVIYDEICAIQPEGAALVPFATAEVSMLRWRSIICPPTPSTWEEYAEIVQMEQWQQLTTHATGRVNVTAVQSIDGSTSVVFADVAFVRSIRCTRFYCDCTFKVCPHSPRVLQLLTIMGQIDGNVLPIAWVLMERKTTEAYLSVLQHFSTVLAPHLRPTSFMTDYETALATALQVTYPEAVSERCFFHFSQALKKQAKTLNLSRLIRACRSRQIVFRRLLALPLLPAHDIIPAFNWIVTHTPAEIARDFNRLFDYFERFWMRTVTPQSFSVFGLQDKTNNVVEAYHRVLKIRMGVHPSIWQFTASLLELQAVVSSSRSSLDFGLAISRPPAEREIVQRQIIQRAWQLYQERLLDIPRFLECAAHFLRAFNNRVLITAANQVDLFINADLDVGEMNDAQVPQDFVEENADMNLHGQPDEDVIHVVLPLQACAVCNENSKDTISLPCHHWFACAACTRSLIPSAARENADIRCAECGEIATSFHTITIVTID